MKEDFLHYLWKFQKINTASLKTTNGETIELNTIGTHNTENSGPDFFNAQLIIDNQKWAGNIEIHCKSSDWYAHQHQNDSAYDNVILHIVWEHDVEVFRNNNIAIPTLELQKITPRKTINQYLNLVNSAPKWINCENQLKEISDFTISNWLERLYFERLNNKSNHLKNLFIDLNNHWEATCFCLLAQYFGGNTNGAHFLKIAKSIPFNVIQKTTNIFQLEALLFGQANLLEEIVDDTYHKSLQNEYQYLKHKYQLKPLIGLQLQFFRLRPSNFPTIRLAQLAQVFSIHHQLFTKINTEFNSKKLQKIFKVSTSEYWKTHYNFGKESKKSIKNLSTSFIDLLIINAILPLQFFYSNTISNQIYNDLLNSISTLKPEKNAIVSKFKTEGITVKNAMHSQAVIQLKKEYCDKNQCLQCAIGFELLKGN